MVIVRCYLVSTYVKETENNSIQRVPNIKHENAKLSIIWLFYNFEEKEMGEREFLNFQLFRKIKT